MLNIYAGPDIVFKGIYQCNIKEKKTVIFQAKSFLLLLFVSYKQNKLSN